MQPLIDVCDLRFRYDDGTEALKGIDFQLAAEKPWRCWEPTEAARPLSFCT